MNTTDLFVEQILIGGLVLLVVAVGYADLSELPWPEGALSEVVALVGFLGAAYLFGIVADRVLDTMTGALESHARLRFLWRTVWKSPAEVPAVDADPFDESHLRYAVAESDGVNAVFNYQRSRIRLARCMAVLLPCLAYAVALRSLEGPWLLAGRVLLPVVVVALLWLKVQKVYDAPPKTHELSKLRDYYDAGRHEGSPLGREGLIHGALLLSAFLASAAWSARDLSPLVVWLGGLAVGAVSGWAWWRILETQATYLWGFGRFQARR